MSALAALARAMLVAAVCAAAAFPAHSQSAGGRAPEAGETTEADPAKRADSVLANLSQHSVSLTTRFSGSELLIYGAIANGDRNPPDVIVAVAGPSKPVTVRKKIRRYGIWLNGPAVRIDAAPSFYALASTRALEETLSYTDDLRYRIRLDRKIRLVDAPEWVEPERDAYREAVSRIRTDQGLYAILPSSVTLHADEDDGSLMLFETRVLLPANLVEGDYEARIFLIRDKQVVDTFTDKIEVRRAGIGRMIYTAAQEQPALYGIASIFIALLAGWLASAFFRTFFPT